MAAPSSTKNAARQRDPEMRQTRKGKAWHFGMKFHVGTDPHGLVHSLTGTDAATADITQLPALLHGAERDLYGDQAYWHADHRVSWEAAGGRYRVNRRGTAQRPLTVAQRRTNRRRSTHRARGEHGFHVVKRLWDFMKVRYRGLAIGRGKGDFTNAKQRGGRQGGQRAGRCDHRGRSRETTLRPFGTRWQHSRHRLRRRCAARPRLRRSLRLLDLPCDRA